ncbi:MAG: aldehyde ferredoxin oxidoreductase family protein [Dehalococcoidales bacterium]|nr:aldehyde ferredoxin oxidoreductase family protein [Dehalococcoidales bacterium]
MTEDKKVVPGYHGKILRVNLTSGDVTTEELDPLFCRRFIGGAGFVAYYLWRELPPNCDALGPDNKLVFALGPISGYNLPGAARHCIGTKSPITNGIVKSEPGGYWAAQFKRTGYDTLIVEGKAPKPVYLYITDKEVSIKDASHLWGKNTKEVEETIIEENDDKGIANCLIGPGGENMVRYACIMSGTKDAAGRGGSGAVMGSKNLKAIAVRGHTLPPLANEERFNEIRKEMVGRPSPLSEFGTGGPDMTGMVETGNLPVRNFRDGLFPVEKITGGVIKDTVRIGMEGCYACPIRCKKVVQFDEPYPCDPAYGGPEYETLAAFGSNCGVDEIKAICKGNELCNAYSLDTISTGGTIAFAMECFERGLLTEKDTDGIDLTWGNSDSMLKLIELIARREGIGDLLAEGTRRLAEKIGNNSVEFAMNAKGLEAGMHEPRLRLAMGFGWIVGPTGADHMFSIMDPNNPFMIGSLQSVGILQAVPDDYLGPKRVAIMKAAHCGTVFTDSLCTCMMAGVNSDAVLPAVTGWNLSKAEQLLIGERILTTMRMFNMKQGLTEADDKLPGRYYQGKTEGPLENKPLDIEKMNKARKYYYTIMGWDEHGVPLPEKAEELYIE